MGMHTTEALPDQQHRVPSGTTFQSTMADAHSARVAVGKLPYYSPERTRLLHQGLRLIAGDGLDLPWVNLGHGTAGD